MGERKVSIYNGVTPTHETVKVLVGLDYLKNCPGAVVELSPAEASHLAIRLLGAAETVRDRQKRAEMLAKGNKIARPNRGRGE